MEAHQSKSEQNRLLILEAAKQLIAERGFNAITLQDLLDAAHVTKGKFFHYFSSKEELFSELLRFALTERAVLRFDEILINCPHANPLGKLLYLLDRLIEWHEEGLPEGMRLCLFAIFFFAPDSPEIVRINQILSSNAEVIERLIRDAQREGVLVKDLDPTTISFLFPSASIGANLVGFLVNKERLTSKSLVELRKMIEHLSLKHVNETRGRR